MKIQSIKCTIHRDPNTKKQVIPLPAMEVAGLERTEELVFHAQEGCILVSRTDMTAGEAIRILTYLNRLSDSLVLQLVDASNQVSSVLPPQPDLLDPFDEEVLKDLVRSGADPDGLQILLEPEAGR